MENPLASIEWALDPFTTYRHMRENQPVYYDPTRGTWNVFRHADVLRILSDYDAFSSQFHNPRQGEQGDHPFAQTLISTDPPRHHQLRALVNQAFTPRAVEALEPRITQIVSECLERVLAQNQMDVIGDLGYPLPVIVIAELLGIPAEDRERFKQWSDMVVSLAERGGDVDYSQYGGGAMMEMAAYFFDMLEKRRKSPGSDLISGLLQASIDGESLNQVELIGFCSLLLVAGNETTTNLIGNAMLSFCEHPDAWERLRRDPSLAPLAVEEVLRYRSPVQSMYRVAKQATTVRGVTLPAGAFVSAWIGSANHDADQFDNPQEFNIARSPNRHLAFGQGIHYCLGAPLARLEGRLALTALLKCFSEVWRLEETPLERLPSLVIFGLKRLPIGFTKA